MLTSASLYFHTLRHLRLEQFLARLRYQLPAPPVPVKAAPAVALPSGRWTIPPGRAASLLGPSRVRLLNRERELAFPEDWQTDTERLWLYNLHYFDDLVASRASDRTGWHEMLIQTWIRDNRPADGVGWEPYPISLRTVNWMKWSLAGNRLDGTALASLATQLRCLRQRVEWHLLGNHLLANAKALVLGGLFFAGDEADEWLEFGSRLLSDQLAEQVLPDGGHFERSPMYHALALEDVLDLLNAMQAYPERSFGNRHKLSNLLPGTAAGMLAWLEVMTHPNGEIALFNDAAGGIALTLAALETYAQSLHVEKRPPSRGLRDLSSSGYVRMQLGPWWLLFDAARVGPDYQPGHAHADTLSFELSVAGERVVSNSGTSTYEQDPQRSFERSTRAHNTVEVDGQNSSEVWAAFRVARRAHPMERMIDEQDGRGFVSCAHDGYRRLRGQPLHRRSVELGPQVLRWTDRVEGGGHHHARGFIPLHPGVQVTLQGTTARLATRERRRLVLASAGIAGFGVEEGSYARGFGLREARPVLRWELSGSLPLEASFTLATEN